MFNSCILLSYVKALFITKPDSSYTSNWLYNVSKTGLFIKNIDATWDDIGSNSIPYGWDIDFANN
jgi:hypothetical protein